MKKQVYISSTYEDLRSHREAAYMNLSLMFVGGKGSFTGMATPKAVRSAMARQDARLEEAYRKSLPGPDLYVDQPGEAAVHTAQNFRTDLEQAEADVKVWMTKKYLTEVLGDELSTLKVDLDAKRPPTLRLCSRRY